MQITVNLYVTLIFLFNLLVHFIIANWKTISIGSKAIQSTQEIQPLQPHALQYFLRDTLLWDCQRLYQWIGQKNRSCLYVIQFDIGPTVPKLDIVKCQGPQFELSNTLVLSKVVPLDLAENSMLFSCKTLCNWPSSSKVRHRQLQRSAVQVPTVPNNFWS